MAYTKKTWVSGETPLSAENMNNIENGIANAHEDISKLNTKLFRSLTTPNDLDNATTTGIYTVTSSELNRPSDWGLLIVFNSNPYVVQLFIGSSYTGTRFWSSYWRDWKSLI